MSPAGFSTGAVRGRYWAPIGSCRPMLRATHTPSSTGHRGIHPGWLCPLHNVTCHVANSLDLPKPINLSLFFNNHLPGSTYICSVWALHWLEVFELFSWPCIIHHSSSSWLQAHFTFILDLNFICHAHIAVFNLIPIVKTNVLTLHQWLWVWSLCFKVCIFPPVFSLVLFLGIICFW